MDDYISKPIRIAPTMAAIARVTGTRPSVERIEEPLPAGNGTPLVDWQQATETVGGDQDLLRELVQVFIAEGEMMLGEIDLAIRSGNPKDLRRSAHALKGALHHLGAIAAAATARELEQMGENETLDNSRALLNILRNQVAQTTEIFQQFVRPDAAAPAE